MESDRLEHMVCIAFCRSVGSKLDSQGAKDFRCGKAEKRWMTSLHFFPTDCFILQLLVFPQDSLVQGLLLSQLGIVGLHIRGVKRGEPWG